MIKNLLISFGHATLLMAFVSVVLYIMWLALTALGPFLFMLAAFGLVGFAAAWSHFYDRLRLYDKYMNKESENG